MKMPCEHGRYVEHALPDDEMTIEKWKAHETCPGGRPPTDEELIEELERRDYHRWQRANEAPTVYSAAYTKPVPLTLEVFDGAWLEVLNDSV